MTVPRSRQAAVEYSGDGELAVRLRKLMLSGVPVRMTLSGPYRELLAPHIVDGELDKVAPVATIPAFDRLLGRNACRRSKADGVVHGGQRRDRGRYQRQCDRERCKLPAPVRALSWS